MAFCTLALTLSRYFSSSSFVGWSGVMRLKAFALTVPSVLGVHASTSNSSLSLTGDRIAPMATSFVHPGLAKSHGSRRPFVKPQDAISLTAHSPAAFRLGEPVNRGPYTSVR